MSSGLPNLEVNGHRIKIAFRDVIWLMMLISSLVGVYFANVYRGRELASDVAGNTRNIASLSSKVESARVESSAAHDDVLRLQQQVSYDSGQITELSHSLRDLTPKVDKIDTNVLWLMSKQMERK